MKEMSSFIYPHIIFFVPSQKRTRPRHCTRTMYPADITGCLTKTALGLFGILPMLQYPNLSKSMLNTNQFYVLCYVMFYVLKE